MYHNRYLFSSVVACFLCLAISVGQEKSPTVNTIPATKALSSAPSTPQGGLVAMNPQYRVLTAEDLMTALKAAAGAKFRCETGYVIWVENNANVDLDAFDNPHNGTNYLIQIPDCVTLAGGRSATEEGGLLYLKNMPSPQTYALSLGNAARVTGLRLMGPSGATSINGNANAAILIKGISQARVDNNEIYDWPHAGVELTEDTNTEETAQQIEVRGNFIHDNLLCGSGYGVAVGHAGYASIDENLFDFNRHAVTDDGCVPGQGECTGNTGYLAYLNFVLSGGATCGGHYNQHFDVHGLGSGCGNKEPDHCGGMAGQYFDIRYNAIRGAQSYSGFLGIDSLTRPALDLRGTPTERAYFRDNAVAHNNQGDAIRTPANNPQPHLDISNIQYKTDTSNELAVGDFDGDGFADVFQATGQVWVYSPRGQREWRFLNQSSIRLSDLAFGDFDGDGKTDVFRQVGSEWQVSYSGTGPWTPLPAGSNIPMSGYGFADIDGDGKTDILRANGTEWFYSSGGATQWKHLNYSKLGMKDIRFGHFNPKNPKETDIFAIVNGQWSVSYAGTSKWQKLNDNLNVKISDLVFGDFNGDGLTDIAYGAGNAPLGSIPVAPNPNTPNSTAPPPLTWYVSWGGRGPFVALRYWTPINNELVPPLTSMLIGDFNSDKHADFLDQELANDGQIYFFLSSAGASPLTQRSLYTVQ